MSALAESAAPAAGVDRDWWRGAVIYQIYPRSFQDANGDGIGDLPGITERLAHVAGLGVDAIWISPICASPMKDFGYDVADYRAIDPMFGTLEDFDEVLRVAHGLDLKVMIDLVISHTSDQHAWFAESRRDRTNPKADWYVWADAKPDGSPPNNWLSVFGGTAWQWDTRRRQYYLHNFLSAQPDLDFHQIEVQDALLDVARFWLDRGVDGFRLDTINFYFCDRALRDNPPLAAERRNDSIAPSVNPYNFQDHVHDKNQPENLVFLARFRALLDEYPAATAVGEVGDAQYGMQIMGQYTAGDERMHMCYAFDFLSREPLGAARVVSVLAEFDRVAGTGWPCWAFSNHDVMRHATRWGLSRAACKLVATLLASLRGSVCLYQGEELGLPEADIAFADLRDPYGIEFWPDFKGRDGCRTPMVWRSSEPSGGFSAGDPWLPVSHEHLDLAVDRQEANPDSVLAHYRELLGFRAGHPTLAKGSLDDLGCDGDVVWFSRRHGNEELHCAFNLGNAAARFELPDGSWEAIASPGSASPGPEAVREGTGMTLAPWQAHFARRI